MRTNSGNSLVELALLLPLMLLLLAGGMDFARVFYAGIAVASGARAGVQYGSFSPSKAGDTNGILQAVRSEVALQGMNPADFNVSSSVFCGCVDSGSAVSCDTGTCSAAVNGTTVPSGYVRVQVSYNFRTLLNWSQIPRNTLITRTATMRVQ